MSRILIEHNVSWKWINLNLNLLQKVPSVWACAVRSLITFYLWRMSLTWMFCTAILISLNKSKLHKSLTLHTLKGEWSVQLTVGSRQQVAALHHQGWAAVIKTNKQHEKRKPVSWVTWSLRLRSKINTWIISAGLNWPTISRLLSDNNKAIW